MTTTQQCDLPELPDPACEGLRVGRIAVEYTADQMREYGRLCRATAEQAGKVEMADCCDTPNYCSSVRRCTRDDAKPMHPTETGDRELIRRLYVELLWCDRQLTSKRVKQGATVRDVLADALARLQDAKPTQPAATQQPVGYVDPKSIENLAGHCSSKEWMWCEPDHGLVPLYAAPVSPSREVEALAAMAARLEHQADTRKKPHPNTLREAAAMLRALAPVQEKAP